MRDFRFPLSVKKSKGKGTTFVLFFATFAAQILNKKSNFNDMNIYTVENLQGVNYEVLGVVTGSTIQSKNVFSDIGQSLKNIVGGELKAYTQMMEKARKMSTDRMIAQAEAMQADAVIGVRYATSAIMAQAAEVLVYGTAIRYK